MSDFEAGDLIVDGSSGERYHVTATECTSLRLMCGADGFWWEMRLPGGEWEPYVPPEDEDFV